MRTLSLIVAEDDAFMREWLLMVLRGLAARVQPAATGRELIAMLAQGGHVDLVISDVRMPGPSGLEVLAAARSEGRQVPFLFITGYPGPEVHAAAAELGATVLDKPFTARQLVARVRQLCAIDDAPRVRAHESQRSNDAK